MMKLISIMILTLALMWVPSTLLAQRSQVSVGPRPIAMGDAFTSIADDYSAIFWNPAGLARIGHQEVALTHANQYGVGLNDNYLAFVLPITRNQAGAADWYNSSFDDGELGFTENRFDLAYGLNIPYRLSLGAAAKLLTVSNSLDGSDVGSGTGFGLDLGLLAGPYRGFRFGVLGQDIFDTQVNYSGEMGNSEVLQSSFRGSVSYTHGNLATLAVDLDDWIHVGAEVLPVDLVALRGGFQTGSSDADEPVWSFGAGFKLNIFRLDYAAQIHPYLGTTNHFGISLAFQFNPAQVRIEEVKADQLYASLNKTYATEPFGTVRVRNLRDEPLTARLSVFLPGTMDSPTEREIVLRPRTIEEIPLNAVFSEEIMNLDEDRPIQIEVAASYRSARVVRTDKGKGKAILYAPGAINWDRGVNQAAAFVTPRDPVVASVAREASRTASLTETAVYPNRNIAFAAAMFNALDVLGCTYVPDPNNPYGTVSEEKYAVDTIHYPRETLQKLTGDCDDTSVLMSSMLENVGVPTKLVDVPGHLMILVGTGVEVRHAAGLALDQGYFAAIDGTLWIPLETTALGGGFANAWARGADAYQDWDARGRVNLVDVTAAQSRYEPSLPTGSESAPELDGEQLAQSLTADSAIISDWRKEYLASRYQGLETDTVVSEAGLNDVAQVFFLAGKFNLALDKLQEALALDLESPRTNNNLGAVYIRMNEPDLALGYLRAAASEDPADPGTLLNLGLVLHQLGDAEQGDAMLDAAVAEAGGFNEVLALLGVRGADEMGLKADETMTRELLIQSLALDTPLYWKP